jgi:hypothetical protein
MSLLRDIELIKKVTGIAAFILGAAILCFVLWSLAANHTKSTNVIVRDGVGYVVNPDDKFDR